MEEKKQQNIPKEEIYSFLTLLRKEYIKEEREREIIRRGGREYDRIRECRNYYMMDSIIQWNFKRLRTRQEEVRHLMNKMQPSWICYGRSCYKTQNVM